MKRPRSITNTLAVIFVLYLFYYSYRYVFQYNSEVTSPSYSNTPVAISITKFVILLIFCAILFLSLISDKINPAPAILCLFIGLFAIQELYAIITIGSIQSITALCCILPALIVLMFRASIDETPFDKICIIFLNYTIIYELIQILLYFSIGRLPALAYDTGILTDVRFGGPWDDPNGFSILLSFFIPYAYHKYKGLKRIIHVLILTASLILTWSLTGLACFILTLLCWGIISIRMRKKRITIEKLAVACFVCLIVLLALIVIAVLFKSQIAIFIDSKSGSIAGHLQGFQINMSIGTLLGITPNAQNAESSIIMLLLRGGIIHLLLFYSLGFFAVRSAYRRVLTTNKSEKLYPLRKSIFFYQISFLFATVNLPFVYAFSNMGIFMLFLLLSFRGNEQVAFPAVHSATTNKLAKNKLRQKGNNCTR